MTTKERFLQAAVSLFSTQGYHATGVNEIVTVSGAPKGSLYHHFPGGKEQLALEVLASERAFVHQALEAALSRSADPVVAVQGFVVDLANHYSLRFQEMNSASSHLSLALLALESVSVGETLRLACVEAFQDWIDLYAAKFAAAGYEADQARELALLVQTLVEGASLLSVTRKETRPLLNLVGRLPALLRPDRPIL